MIEKNLATELPKLDIAKISINVTILPERSKITEKIQRSMIKRKGRQL